MKDIISKKDFLKQLRKKLRFKYSRNDISGILSDYNEFFETEISQGKTEKEVCSALGNPAAIVYSLDRENPPKDTFIKNLFAKDRIIQTTSFTMICLIIFYIIYSSKHGHEVSMLPKLLILLPFLVVFSWIVLARTKYISQKVSDFNIRTWRIGGIHLLCFFAALFLSLFMNPATAGWLISNRKPEQIGEFLSGILYLFTGLLCSLILFSIYQFIKGSISYFSVICHALGIITMIFYYIHVMHSLSTPEVYSLLIMESGFLYLETIVIIAIFFILKYKRRAL